MKADLLNSEYFNSLPLIIQESILQSGASFDSEDELRKFVSNINEAKN